MAGDLVQVPLGHQGGLGQQVAPLLLGVLDPALEQLDHPGPLGQQHGQALADDVHGGEVLQLPAQLVVVPLQSLGLLLQIGVQLVLLGEGHAIDALEHLAVGVAPPVGAGGGGQLDGVALDAAGGVQVGAGAQVHKLALLVEGDDLVLGQVVDEFHLVRLLTLFHQSQSLSPGQLEPLQLHLLLADLAHLAFQLGEILGGEGAGGVKVIVEAVLNGGANGQLHLGVQPLHGLSQHMGTGVPIGLAVLGIFKGVQILFFAHGIALLSIWFGAKGYKKPHP